MSISVLKPGLLTTIQDSGRYGYQKYGVVVSGAMDSYDMKLANIAVGNDENEGVLEITMIGPSLKIGKGELISITGADISPTINKKKVPRGRPIYIREECILEFGSCKAGCRAYMAVSGGFNIEDVMESKSTYLRGSIGGMQGRALKKGDVIEIKGKSELAGRLINKLKESKNNKYFSAPKWYMKNYYDKSANTDEIRVFEDMQFNRFSQKSIDDFFNDEFIVDSKSDRMGYRLSGPQIKLEENMEMVSGEVSFGTIQIPPDGNPIILLADRATAGGYPKIAHVCSCDIPKLVQLKPAEKIRFKKIKLEEADKLYIEMLIEIEEVKKSIELISL